MKSFLIFFILLSTAANAQDKLSDISFTDADNKEVQAKNFEGRKLLIAIAGAAYLQRHGLSLLNGLAEKYPDLNVVLVPGEDLGEDSATTGKVTDSLNQRKIRNVSVSRSGKVKKAAKQQQHPLVQFVTNVQSNTHFDNDITTDLTVCVVSESGVMYALLEEGFFAKTLDEILQQSDVKK